MVRRLVWLVHAGLGNRRDMLGYAKWLLTRGYMRLLVDQRGCGASRGHISLGVTGATPLPGIHTLLSGAGDDQARDRVKRVSHQVVYLSVIGAYGAARKRKCASITLRINCARLLTSSFV